MSEQLLHKLLEEAHLGDRDAQNQAYGDLVRLITIFVRGGMSGRLRNYRDSMDVSQSIAKSFLVDHRSGGLNFPNEPALIGYLKSVVHSKLAELARYDSASKRGGPGRTHDFDNANFPSKLASTDLDRIPDKSVTQGEQLRSEEALAVIQSRFDQRDQTIARMRLAGESWDQIAVELDEDASALRKYWSRMAASLARDLHSEG